MSECKFADADVVRALTGSSDRVVCLRFTNCEDRCLYAHGLLLSAWSGVLKNVLEDTQQVSATDSSSSSTGDRTIPLDDADTAAWEDCLALMYPSRPFFKITWENAQRLLRLAIKYDMPGVEAHVVGFMSGSPSSGGTSSSGSTTTSSTRLEAHLSASNAACWLELTSACRLEEQADQCIMYIVDHLEHCTFEMDLLSSVQPQHLSELFRKLQQRCRAMQQLYKAAARPLSLPVEDYLSVQSNKCSYCGLPWFRQPEGILHYAARPGDIAPYCLYCGRARKEWLR